MDKSLIQKIVKVSGVKEHELVLVQFWGEDKDCEIMHSFAAAVTALGASPIEVQQSRTANAEKFKCATEQAFSDKYFQLMSSVDAVLDVFSYRPVVLGTKLDDTQTGYYRRYMASLFKALSGAKRFIQIRLPNDANAEESGLAADEYTRRMLAAYDVDYAALHEFGVKRIAELDGKESIEIITNSDCRLRFNLSGRNWILDAGEGDMPCGEIYIAPVEHETNGRVYFDKLYAADFGVYECVILTIEKGIVIHADNEALNQQFKELDTADRTVCELGFGINPNVKTLCGYPLLDEKSNGTFHIAIGSNVMFGGKNAANLHIDFVGTAEIKFGG